MFNIWYRTINKKDSYRSPIAKYADRLLQGKGLYKLGHL
jgi:hypothetical protein